MGGLGLLVGHLVRNHPELKSDGSIFFSHGAISTKCYVFAYRVIGLVEADKAYNCRLLRQFGNDAESHSFRAAIHRVTS